MAFQRPTVALPAMEVRAHNKVAYYRFTATATAHFLDVINVIPLGFDQVGLGYRVYSGACNGDVVAKTLFV